MTIDGRAVLLMLCLFATGALAQVDRKSTDAEALAHLDKYYPFVEQGADAPGRFIEGAGDAGAAVRSRGRAGWRTRHGVAVVLWSDGRPSRAWSVRVPDGTRSDINRVRDHGWRRRAADGSRWIYGEIEIRPDDVRFVDGAQPVYKAPAASEVPDLERDLSSDVQFRKALLDERFADAVYSVLRNREFVHIASGKKWSCGISQAAGIVAGLRGLGDSYQDFYPYVLLEGVYPDDRAEREQQLRNSIEGLSQPLGAVPSGLRPETEELMRKSLEEWKSRTSAAELAGLETERLSSLKRTEESLARIDVNSDVFAAVKSHLTRLGWRVWTSEAHRSVNQAALAKRVEILRRIKELEGMPLETLPAWALPIEKPKPSAGWRVIINQDWNRMSAEQREAYMPERLRNRLIDLAKTGRISEAEYAELRRELDGR
jgi:hypothetical protein